MRQTLYGAFLTATLLVPVVAQAMPNRELKDPTASAGMSMPKVIPNRVESLPNNNGGFPAGGAIGTGMLDGTDPSHVNGPGSAAPDLDTRGVLNVLQPGAQQAGSMGVPQERNPPPARPTRAR
jgi:hypothetical protein